jgi:hypothetical protein
LVVGFDSFFMGAFMKAREAPHAEHQDKLEDWRMQLGGENGEFPRICRL